MSFSLGLPSKFQFSLRKRLRFGFYSGPSSIIPQNPIRLSLSASLAERNRGLESSSSWGDAASIDYNGWDIDDPALEPVNRNGFNAFPVFVVAASIAAVFGLISCFLVPGKVSGFKAACSGAPHEVSVSSVSGEEGDKNEGGSTDELREDAALVTTDTEELEEQKPAGIFVSFTVDSAQQESLLSLKKLKIIEDDARAEELCTRREYARWLVRTNSLLERRRMHLINTCAVLSGSLVNAFDDVGSDDPDFGFIQSLAEVGAIRSKLFTLSDADGGKGHVYFFPDRFLSRKDLVSWKGKLEYEPSLKNHVEMSRMNTGFLDLREISSDGAILLLDLLADENSIIRSVFGHCRRLQPNKPCSRGQAAVALMSGRMREFIRAEISRLEAESLAQQDAKEEILSELLEKGDIQKYWVGKIREEQTHGMEVEVEYRLACTTLEQEKSFLESSLFEMVKQRASLDCQKELVSSIREEVMEMSEKLSLERAKCIDERHGMQDSQREKEAELEKLHDAKSVLEAEVEAVRILRSWVEEEARKNQARAKLLEAAVQRWKWDG